MKSSSMSSHHNLTQKFSNSTHISKVSLKEIDQKIKMGELRLRYVKLMRDFHTSLGYEDATDLIKESMDIWEKLSQQKI